MKVTRAILSLVKDDEKEIVADLLVRLAQLSYIAGQQESTKE
jgi:hypothetical protein